LAITTLASFVLVPVSEIASFLGTFSYDPSRDEKSPQFVPRPGDEFPFFPGTRNGST
jgi:hypothetical protein